MVVYIAVCLAGLVGSPVRQVSAQKEAVRQPLAIPPLRSDVRLQSTLSVVKKAITVGDLLQAVADKTRVPLSARADLRHQRLHLRVTDKRAVHLLTNIADLLGAEWLANADGYVLARTEENRRYQDTWWKLYGNEVYKTMVQAGRILTEDMGAVDPDAFPLSLDLIPADQKQPHENGLANIRFWYHLPAETKAALAKSLSFGIIYPRLPRSLGDGAEGGYILPFAPLPAKCKEAVYVTSEQLPMPFDRNTVDSLLVTAEGFGFGTTLILKDGTTSGSMINFDSRRPLAIPAFGVDHREIPAILERKKGSSPPSVWQKLIAYQKATVWQNDLPPHDIPAWVTPRLSDVLEQMADKTGTDFIADDYALPQRPLSDKEKADEWKEPLEQKLNALAAQHDASWRKTDNIVCFRNNRWYRDDNLEAPQPVLDRLAKISVDAETNMPADMPEDLRGIYHRLECAAFAVTNLTVWQIPNGLYFYVDGNKVPAWDKQTLKSLQASDCQPFPDIAALAFQYRKTCAFYASLSREQRIVVLTGSVPMTALSPVQKKLLLVAAPRMAGVVSSSRHGIQLANSGVNIAFSRDYLWGNAPRRNRAAGSVYLWSVALPEP